MKTIKRTILGALLLVSAVALALPQQAAALGTASGTSIANRATVNYQVGGVPQAAIGSSMAGNTSGPGSDTTFLVDDKVMMAVASNSGSAIVTYPSDTTKAVNFTVTNTGNAVHDFALSAAEIATTTVTGATTAFYADTNGNNQYDSGTDLALPVSGSAYIAELVSDATATVFLVITVPAGAANGETANYSVTAEAHQGGGAGLGALTSIQATADALIADVPGTIQVVLADAAGDSDAAKDGVYTKNGGPGFTVSTATLTVSKTSAVYWDPINLLANPKAIPGAIVTYTVTIANGSAVNATNVSIVDDLTSEVAAHVSFVTRFNDGTGASCDTAGNGISVGGTCLTNVYAGDDGASWDDAGDPLGTGGNKVVVSGQTVVNGTPLVIKYQVQITQ